MGWSTLQNNQRLPQELQLWQYGNYGMWMNVETKWNEQFFDVLRTPGSNPWGWRQAAPARHRLTSKNVRIVHSVCCGYSLSHTYDILSQATPGETTPWYAYWLKLGLCRPGKTMSSDSPSVLFGKLLRSRYYWTETCWWKLGHISGVSSPAKVSFNQRKSLSPWTSWLLESACVNARECARGCLCVWEQKVPNDGLKLKHFAIFTSEVDWFWLVAMVRSRVATSSISPNKMTLKCSYIHYTFEPLTRLTHTHKQVHMSWKSHTDSLSSLSRTPPSPHIYH